MLEPLESHEWDNQCGYFPCQNHSPSTSNGKHYLASSFHTVLELFSKMGRSHTLACGLDNMRICSLPEKRTFCLYGLVQRKAHRATKQNCQECRHVGRIPHILLGSKYDLFSALSPSLLTFIFKLSESMKMDGSWHITG